jgi:hypothetical protein
MLKSANLLSLLIISCFTNAPGRMNVGLMFLVCQSMANDAFWTYGLERYAEEQLHLDACLDTLVLKTF